MLSSEVTLEQQPCPLGCAPQDELVLVGRDRLHNLPGEFRVVRCDHCGLARTDPRPTPETIGYYYPADYGPYLSTQVVAQPTASPRWKQVIRRYIEMNTERLPVIPPGRMLEIGCASGRFMHQMAGRGWQVEGIEMSAQAAARARVLGYPVYTGQIESAPTPDLQYDLVVGWMVLEHLHDPVSALRKLCDWTRPGGWIALSVPNAAALEAQAFGDAWFALQLPTHLYHYTPKTIQRILAAGGWQYERLFHQRIISSLIVSLGYVLGDWGVPAQIVRPLLRFPDYDYSSFIFYPLGLLFGAFGQTGRMTVWARKPVQ